MEAAEHGADVDRDDVAFAQDATARDAVDDLVVDRGADVAGEPVVTQER